MGFKNLKTLVIIPARGGSKSIKDKNLSKIGSKSLIEHLFNSFKNINQVDQIICSTDSKKIIQHCKKIELKTELREKKYCQDNSNIQDYLISFAKKNKLYDIILLAQPTSPFVRKKDVEEMIRILKTTRYNSSQTITKVSHNNHYLNQRNFSKGKVNFKFEKERLKMFNKQKKKSSYIFGNLIGVKRISLIKQKNIFAKSCYGIEIPLNNAIDIDTKHDLIIANLLYKNYKIF